MNYLPKVVICDLGIYLRINDIVNLKMSCKRMDNIENFTTNEIECTSKNLKHQSKIFKLFKRFNSLIITNLDLDAIQYINTFNIEKIKIIDLNINTKNYITDNFPYLNELYIMDVFNQELKLNNNLTKLTIINWGILRFNINLPLDNKLFFLEIFGSKLPINLNKSNIRHLSIGLASCNLNLNEYQNLEILKFSSRREITGHNDKLTDLYLCNPELTKEQLTTIFSMTQIKKFTVWRGIRGQFRGQFN